MTVLLDAAAFALIVAALYYGLGALAGWAARRRPIEDPALDIRPPRRFVDEDGRSDYRPELREAAAARRAEGRPW